MTSSSRIYLLPGMGADARMYDELSSLVPGLQVIPWIPAVGGESLGDYAERMAASVAVEPADYLGGSSFGGMVALEMARHRSVEGIILIGSCRSSRALAPLLQVFNPLASLVPVSVYGMTSHLSPLAGAKFGLADSEHKRRFSEMLADADPAFIKWACGAILSWPGYEDAGVPVAAIHGGEDRLIPASRVQADRVIRGAGHLVAMTHARDVAAFMESVRGAD